MRSFGILERTCALILDKNGSASFIQRRDKCHETPLHDPRHHCSNWKQDSETFCQPCRRYLEDFPETFLSQMSPKNYFPKLSQKLSLRKEKSSFFSPGSMTLNKISKGVKVTRVPSLRT